MCKCEAGMLENKCGVCHDWIRQNEVIIYVEKKDYYIHSECETDERADTKTCESICQEP